MCVLLCMCVCGVLQLSTSQFPTTVLLRSSHAALHLGDDEGINWPSAAHQPSVQLSLARSVSFPADLWPVVTAEF